MIWKKVGIRKSDRISNQQKAIKRRMKNSTELDLPERISQQQKAINRRMKIPTDSDFPEQSHRGEDPVKIRRMSKLNTQKIEYGANHEDKKEIPLDNTCSQEEYHEVLSGSEKFRDLVDILDGMKTLKEEEYDPLFEI